MACCEMKGYLTLLILWNVRTGHKTGQDIAEDLEKRRGTRPSPGTIYPALKDLKDKRLVNMDKEKRYALTKAGERELDTQLETFFIIFSDMDEMRECCRHKP